MSDRGPLIFISYSFGKDDEQDPEEVALTRSLRDRLETELQDQGYRIFIDENSIHPTEAWKQKIRAALENCDAAIILLSRAALRSRWVRYETGRLFQRWEALEQDFRLFCVRFPDVSSDDIDETFDPDDVSQLQHIVLSGPEDEDQSVSQIVENMTSLRDQPKHELELKLFRVLRDHVKVHSLEEIAGLLPHCHIRNLLGYDRHRKVARALLDPGVSVGKERLETFLEVVHTLASLEREHLLDIINIVTPFCWVEQGLARRLPEIAAHDDLPRAAIWIRKWKLSENMHLLRAFCHDRFQLVDTNEDRGEDDDIFNHVRRSLARTLTGESDADEEELRMVLEDWNFQDEPIFVLLPLQAVEPDIVRQLIGDWPDMTFFFFLRPRDLEKQALETFVPADIPQMLLDLQKERRAKINYNKCINIHNAVRPEGP